MPFVHDRPSAFRRPTLLIVGCGDVGMRVAALLKRRFRLLALTSSPGRIAELRAAGITPLAGNLDEPASLARLAGLADALLHLAPPQPQGTRDRRTTALLHAMARGGRLRRVVYSSTSGVYGDCGGARIDETRRPRPATDRARRRLDAEQQLRRFGRALGVQVSLLRVPGLYAVDRAGVAERVARGAPLPERADRVYTNHIHADDLARACVAALMRGRPQRVVHVSDDSELTLGAYFDLTADLSGQARLPRVGALDGDGRPGGADPATAFAASAESRRLANARLKRELRLRLRYPTVAEGLAALQWRR